MIFNHFERLNENLRKSMKIYEDLRKSTKTYFLFHAKVVILVNLFTQKLSFWWLFDAKVVILVTFSCKSRHCDYFLRKSVHFDDFLTQRSSYAIHGPWCSLVILWISGNSSHDDLCYLTSRSDFDRTAYWASIPHNKIAYCTLSIAHTEIVYHTLR